MTARVEGDRREARAVADADEYRRPFADRFRVEPDPGAPPARPSRAGDGATTTAGAGP